MKKISNIALSVLLSASFAFTAFGLDKEVPFVDISQDSWYYSYVSDVYEKEIIAGTTETTFGPDVTLNRGMAASLIYRMYGSPNVSYSKQFTDVEKDKWYTDGILWAKENGIIFGYEDGSFCPDWAISTEQFASILYRLAGSPENSGDVHVLDKYSDDFLVSSYAMPAMVWAVENDMLYGSSLHPSSAMTRAEAAKMLSVFTTMYDSRAIKATGAISDYIRKNYDTTFDFTEYEFSVDESGYDIYLYYKVEGWRSTFGYRAVMFGDKLLRVEMIGKMNPYLLSTELTMPEIPDEEVLKMALEDAGNEFTVSSQVLYKYFDMDELKFVYAVDTVYTDKAGAEFAKEFKYEA